MKTPNYTIDHSNGEISLYGDGKFMINWDQPKEGWQTREAVVPVYMVRQMLDKAFEDGAAARSEQLRKILGCR